jgi:hypothetical protein
MSMATMSQVVTNCVRGQEGLHEPSEVAFWSLQHQMEVVIHKAKEKHPHAMTRHAFIQTRVHDSTIGIVLEYVLPTVATHRDMIDSTGVFHS